MRPERDALEQPHTIVVGGGLAGLAAATYLARGGQRVTLLEKAPSIGGRAIADLPHGFALNRGVHALYRGGAASQVLRELGVTYSSGSPKNVFAHDARGLHRFPTDASSLLTTSFLAAAEKLELMRVFTRLPGIDATQLGHQSVADWLAATARSPRIRGLLAATARVSLYTAALDLASADAFVSRLQQSMKYPIDYVSGGWQSLVDGLHEAASAAGVAVRTSAGVLALQCRDGHVVGVQLHDGTELHASEVVIALALSDARKLLADVPAARTLTNWMGQMIPAPVACLDLALSRLPSRRYPVVFDVEQPLFATAQSEFADLAPAGGAVVHLMKQLDPRASTNPQQDRADLERFMQVMQPGWRDLVVESRFLPHILAASALPLASGGGLTGRPEHTVAENLYVAGDWVGPRGWLVDATLDSARDVAQTILKVHNTAHAARPYAEALVASAA